MDKTEIKAKYFRGTEEPLFFRDNLFGRVEKSRTSFFLQTSQTFSQKP